MHLPVTSTTSSSHPREGHEDKVTNRNLDSSTYGVGAVVADNAHSNTPSSTTNDAIAIAVFGTTAQKQHGSGVGCDTTTSAHLPHRRRRQHGVRRGAWLLSSKGDRQTVHWKATVAALAALAKTASTGAVSAMSVLGNRSRDSGVGNNGS